MFPSLDGTVRRGDVGGLFLRGGRLDAENVRSFDAHEGAGKVFDEM